MKERNDAQRPHTREPVVDLSVCVRLLFGFTASKLSCTNPKVLCFILVAEAGEITVLEQNA